MKRTFATHVGLAVSLFLVLVGWAVSSPVGASPDDDYHLTSIWCSSFSDAYPCPEIANSDGELTVLAPRLTVEAHACYAFKPEQTADCSSMEVTDERLTDRVNQIQHLYPTGFYLVQSMFAGDDYVASVIAMRLFNAFLAAGLLLAFLLVGTRPLRSSVLLAIPVIIVPTGLFLMSSTNPSSWTILGTTFYFLFIVNALIAGPTSRSYWPSIVLAVVSAAMALVSRVDGSAFIVVVSVAAALLVSQSWRERKVGAWVALGVMAVISAGVFLAQDSGPVGSESRIGDSEYVGGLFLDNFLEVPGYLAGMVGLGPLGWADTRMPGLVSTIGLIAFGAIAFWGLQVMNRAKALASVVLLVATLGIPVYVAQQERILVLDFIQPRYLMPLAIVLLIAVVTTVPPLKREPLTAIPHSVVTVGLAMAGVVALWVNFHRYALGADEPLFSRDMQFLWPGLAGGSTALWLAIAGVATVAFFALAQFDYRRGEAEGAENDKETAS